MQIRNNFNKLNCNILYSKKYYSFYNLTNYLNIENLNFLINLFDKEIYYVSTRFLITKESAHLINLSDIKEFGFLTGLLNCLLSNSYYFVQSSICSNKITNFYHYIMMNLANNHIINYSYKNMINLIKNLEKGGYNHMQSTINSILCDTLSNETNDVTVNPVFKPVNHALSIIVDLMNNSEKLFVSFCNTLTSNYLYTRNFIKNTFLSRFCVAAVIMETVFNNEDNVDFNELNTFISENYFGYNFYDIIVSLIYKKYFISFVYIISNLIYNNSTISSFVNIIFNNFNKDNKNSTVLNILNNRLHNVFCDFLINNFYKVNMSFKLYNISDVYIKGINGFYKLVNLKYNYLKCEF